MSAQSRLTAEAGGGRGSLGILALATAGNGEDQKNKGAHQKPEAALAGCSDGDVTTPQGRLRSDSRSRSLISSASSTPGPFGIVCQGLAEVVPPLLPLTGSNLGTSMTDVSLA